jgi:hypothetical protein
MHICDCICQKWSTSQEPLARQSANARRPSIHEVRRADRINAAELIPIGKNPFFVDKAGYPLATN